LREEGDKPAAGVARRESASGEFASGPRLAGVEFV
jgi:hypothetical protein